MSSNQQTLSIIKPDAVERNLENDIKKMFIDNNFKILNEKKFKLKNQRQKNFIKFMRQNLFITIYVNIYPLVQ